LLLPPLIWKEKSAQYASPILETLLRNWIFKKDDLDCFIYLFNSFPPVNEWTTPFTSLILDFIEAKMFLPLFQGPNLPDYSEVLLNKTRDLLVERSKMESPFIQGRTYRVFAKMGWLRGGNHVDRKWLINFVGDLKNLAGEVEFDHPSKLELYFFFVSFGLKVDKAIQFIKDLDPSDISYGGPSGMFRKFLHPAKNLSSLDSYFEPRLLGIFEAVNKHDDPFNILDDLFSLHIQCAPLPFPPEVNGYPKGALITQLGFPANKYSGLRGLFVSNRQKGGDGNRFDNDDAMNHFQNQLQAGESLWFHGTSASTADEIVGVGAGLASHIRSDFSFSGAFYLTNRFEHARKRAIYKFVDLENERYGILIYAVNLQGLGGNGVTFETPNNPQIRDVNYNNWANYLKSCANPNHTKYDWIIGPASANLGDVRRYGMEPEMTTITQLCVRTDNALQNLRLLGAYFL